MVCFFLFQQFVQLLNIIQNKLIVSITEMSPHQQSVTWQMLKVYLTVLVILALFAYLDTRQETPSLYQINNETHQMLHALTKTKYFRLFRANLNQQCELYVRNKICKSKSCTVCRCDEKDIPTNWIKTDQVKKSFNSQLDLWQHNIPQGEDPSHESSLNWIWHVEDQENKEGEYFDLDANVESFTNYNGSTIWHMIYEENCFTGAWENYTLSDTCKEQVVFYKVISGLHTSISSHLARFYKSPSQQLSILKGLQSFTVNHSLYQQRVLDHPQRVENLLFIYQIYLRAAKQISSHISQNYMLLSENVTDDFITLGLLRNLSKKVDNYQFRPFDDQLKTFFYKQNPKVNLYQKYIHNISRLMNCVECEKCRLFGKMQTYGIGTALKILLGYNEFYKRNEIVAFYNAWNKISMSVQFYYQTVGKPRQQSLQVYDFFWLRWFATIAGAFIIFIYLTESIEIDQKVKKLFKNVKFPAERRHNHVSSRQFKSTK